MVHRGRSGTWSRIDGGGLRIEDVWSAGERRAWAVGRSPIGGEAILIEGDEIVRRDPLELAPTMIVGRAADDVWAAASEWRDMRYHTTVFHFDGTSWTVAARLGDVGARARSTQSRAWCAS